MEKKKISTTQILGITCACLAIYIIWDLVRKRDSEAVKSNTPSVSCSPSVVIGETDMTKVPQTPTSPANPTVGVDGSTTKSQEMEKTLAQIEEDKKYEEYQKYMDELLGQAKEYLQNKGVSLQALIESGRCSDDFILNYASKLGWLPAPTEAARPIMNEVKS